MNKKKPKKNTNKKTELAVSKKQSKSTKRDSIDDSDIESDDDNKDYEDFTNPLLLDKLEKKDLKHDKLKETEHDSDTDVYDDSDDDDENEDLDEEDEPEIAEKISSEFVTNKYKIPDKDRTTSHRLTNFEYTRLLEVRISMLQHQSSSMVNNENLSYAEEIAKKEIYDRTIPFTLTRKVGIDKKKRILYEEWDPKEMTLPVFSSALS